MEEHYAPTPSPEHKPSSEADEQTRRALGAAATMNCSPECRHQLDSSSARRPGMSQEQLDKMIAKIHEEELGVLLNGVYDSDMRAKIETSYWEVRKLQPRFS